ncbi:hypothetical protein [Mesorhizobium sp.]|nr:hypothetical protein [Mesorhizobium sp.]
MATSIRLSPEVEQRLDFLAAKTGRSKAVVCWSGSGAARELP